jgi:phospholipid/cholesterol/gamma-HCH transport system substrate-binding protein
MPVSTRLARFCALLGTVALLLGTSGCGLVGGGERTVTVMLGDSAGLFVGNDVGVLGVRVGKVTAIEPDGPQVEVTLSITDGDIKVPADAGAAVVARSVATDRYVELTPVYRGGPELRDGATIPVERTVTPVDFDQVLASLDKLAGGLVDNPRATNSLKDLVAISARNLRGRGDQINRTLRSLSTATRALNSQSDDAVATMRSLDTLTSALAGDERTVRRFITQVAAATSLLAQERRNIGRALRSLSAAVDDLNAFVKRHRGRIEATIVDATAVTENLVKARRDLAEVAQVLPLATDNLARTQNPRNRNIRVRAQLTQVFPLVDGVFEQLCGRLGGLCQGLTLPPDLNQLLGTLSGAQGRGAP